MYREELAELVTNNTNDSLDLHFKIINNCNSKPYSFNCNISLKINENNNIDLNVSVQKLSGFTKYIELILGNRLHTFQTFVYKIMHDLITNELYDDNPHETLAGILFNNRSVVLRIVSAFDPEIKSRGI